MDFAIKSRCEGVQRRRKLFLSVVGFAVRLGLFLQLLRSSGHRDARQLDGVALQPVAANFRQRRFARQHDTGIGIIAGGFVERHVQRLQNLDGAQIVCRSLACNFKAELSPVSGASMASLAARFASSKVERQACLFFALLAVKNAEKILSALFDAANGDENAASL